MKVKNWLIHKLGGITLEDAYRERCNLIQYKQSNIVTYGINIEIPSNLAIKKEFIEKELSYRMFDVIKENIEIECIGSSNKDTVEYRGILRVVKVE